MIRAREQPLPLVFAYPEAPHARRHGPRGYLDDEHYKPWLRDDFSFRCVYCLCREVWFPEGDAGFSVEHVVPTSLAAEGLTDYGALVYACCQCNATRRAVRLSLDPSGDLRTHLEVASDGTIRGLTPDGVEFIRICRLDRPNLTAYRRLVLDVLALLRRKRGSDAADLLQRYLGHPANLPNLAALKPPAGNSRPEGIAESAFARRQRGELPNVY